jgi:Zn-dependent M16 (insulinase) family peptidase
LTNLPTIFCVDQAIVSFTNQALKGVPQDFQVKLLEKYQAVTVDDVIATLQKYFLPLFDPSKTVALVVTAPSKIDQIVEDLTAAGFEVSKRSLETDPQDLEDDGDSESEGSSEEK